MVALRFARALVAIAVVFAIGVPVLAAGVPACCISRPEPAASAHGCCPPPAPAAAPKGCCKSPEAPKSERRVDPSIAAGVSPHLPVAALPRTAHDGVSDLAAFRIARREHRAVSPDDSPPDRLTRLRTLLI